MPEQTKQARMAAAGLRLAEERRRLGLTQVELARRVDASKIKQSLYESGRRELKAAYLEKAAQAGIDILYVLTSRRRTGDLLDTRAAELISAYLGLPAETQSTVLRFTQSLSSSLRD